ncbi:MAG: DUF3850 domain-containing protein [Clostridia bacterium]|nr:DUF3850 domain-containing protein [Clostridia bacterium]
MARIHEIKCLPEVFELVVDGKKKFEIRKDDRGYKEGDFLAMNEYDGERYTGRSVLLMVDYILDPNDVASCVPGYVVLSVRLVPVMPHGQGGPIVFEL